MSFEVNKRITECRIKAKMTKKEVALRLGIKYTTYCRMEEKAKRITNAEVYRIAEVIGADANYILHGEEDLFAPIYTKPLVVKSPKEEVLPFPYDESKSDKSETDTSELPVLKYREGEFTCSAEEKSLIKLYRGYSPENKQKARKFLENLQ